MFLYNLSLQPTTAISAAILGHFSGEKQQEIVVVRQQRLELWHPNTATGKISIVHSEDIFCRIRNIAQFRLTGGSKDYIMMAADTGALAVLEYNPKKKQFNTIQYHEFGRTGLRRLIPGQYVAADPRGRAVMIAGAERSKLVYIVTRDSEANLMLASPLEANKAHSICFDIVGVDVGYENPIFAAIETNYEDMDTDFTGQGLERSEKLLVYYELDLGLNHVVRKWSTPVSKTANKLIALPGSTDGPSGVLVCSEGFIEYKHAIGTTATHKVPIPRRVNPLEDKSRGLMIISSAVHRMKNAFFILAQADTGDLYKVTVEYADNTVSRVGIKYFDTIAPASTIRILRAGFLFAANADGGNHQFYQFENLGDEIDSEEYYSVDGEDTQLIELAYFQPHELSSLGLVDEIESLCPVLKSQVLNIAEEESPQIYALCGRGARSSLKIIRHGLEVSELAVSELPGTPKTVWTVKKRDADEFDDYIVVSFLDATLVLSVGEEVEEVTDSGLLNTAPTLCLNRLDGDGIVQVTPRAVRHILADGRVNEWLPPQNREINCATANNRQVVVSLSRTGGQSIYFELDSQLGVLREHEERLHIGNDATCVSLSPIPEGRLHAAFLAVGCEDQTVRVFSLDPQRCLEPLSMQAVAEVAHSIEIVDQLSTLILYMGLRNGLLMRANVDTTSGELDDTRTRLLGTRAIQLCKARINGTNAVLALSSSPWLCHAYQGRLRTTPLSYDTLDFASGFISEQCAEGVVCVSGDTLRILTIDRLDSVFNQASIPLSYTPRDFVLNDASRHFAIIESEHAHMSTSLFKRGLFESGAVENNEEAEGAVLPPEQFGLIRSKAGDWASLIRVLNPFDGESTQTIELEENTAAISIVQVSFTNHEVANPHDKFLAVGCVTSMTLKPRGFESASIRLYRWNNEGTGLELVHVTPVDDIPQALMSFNGMLLVGIGRALRLYDLGIKRLLKKAQTMVAPNTITALHPHPTSTERFFIADVQESIQLATFNQNTRNFHVILDDTLPRYITSFHVLGDGDTVIAGDKFGNLFGIRSPESVSKSLDADPTGNRLIYEKPKLGGSAYRWNSIAEYHVGDIVTSLTTCSLSAGSRPIIFYTTLLGSLQVAIPFVSQGDVDFFRSLELNMRKHRPPTSGRDHLTYRSAFMPVRSVIDGDLCEQYYMLDEEKRELVSDDVDRTQQDIFKKLEDMRSLFAF
ncbi:pre-mRNA-splicing factor rse1 [Coemansia spiralis]|uniref:Pre-mRNA-splicing factor rse1 n=2 Tax=Coemansia TaxID=4863 RepID=A0A9W8KY62_9FUNG|nr:pre-mRNA-splicing factor rse1 [Coemansia umbellata]KAJ2626117.1 pre-mRNA-splicing factor rse1 [Coemansia sp. RSA 1358]KAJ2676258.1 pre-mRNA-splicing factor rse1 [Coemansia spiralis]